jgi:hypothetical protein
VTPSLPSHHENPETTHEEPIYLFTDEAVVPPGPECETPPSPPNETERQPPASPPDLPADQ